MTMSIMLTMMKVKTTMVMMTMLMVTIQSRGEAVNEIGLVSRLCEASGS